jgi:murein DD-endopeptidase MepM/ murein hydrolase activator NlpD
MPRSLKRASCPWRCYIASIFLLFSSAAGAELYKYQDDSGIWHYSDIPPQGEGPRVESGNNLPTQQQVIIHLLGKQEAPIFEVSNSLPSPIELEFSAKQMQNMAAEPPLPIHKVIAAGSREPLTRFSPIQPDLPWNYAYATRFVLGDPNAKHISGKPYLPPFPSRKEFTISQAFNGEQSHKQHTLTRYAVDIPMPEESPVNAARSGTMVEKKKGKLSPKSDHATYYVRILHRDGTFGLYANLAPDSVKFQPGMEINRGQRLGMLQKTKDGSEPFLHFAVQKNTGMKLESIPFSFTSLDGTPQVPKAGSPLRHPL